MEDFVVRMKHEAEELNEKITKLHTFILSEKFKELEPKVRNLMQAQLHAMEVYLFLLDERLKIYLGD